MNKRIRKKQRKRALRELLAMCADWETVRKLIFHKALQDVTDAYGKSHEEFSAALRRYMETSFLLETSGSLSEFLTAYWDRISNVEG